MTVRPGDSSVEYCCQQESETQLKDDTTTNKAHTHLQGFEKILIVEEVDKILDACGRPCFLKIGQPDIMKSHIHIPNDRKDQEKENDQKCRH